MLDNKPGVVDGHDVVVRVNNYQLSDAAGFRTDVFYSFFGNSIRKTAAELRNDRVTLCMCKCPDAHVINSPWHAKRKKMNGVDFRYIYRNRAEFWFCDTYIPTAEEFLELFNVLNKHMPTTGFAAIWTVLQHQPKSVYLTGFDFFRSGIHNVTEPWRKGDVNDPIKHEPEAERCWLIENRKKYPLSFDPKLKELIEQA